MKAYSVEIEPEALNDLLEIEEFMGRRNPRAAREMMAVLLGAFESIALYKEIGRPARQMRRARYYVVSGHRIYYRAEPKAEAIYILRVFNTRRDVRQID